MKTPVPFVYLSFQFPCCVLFSDCFFAPPRKNVTTLKYAQKKIIPSEPVSRLRETQNDRRDNQRGLRVVFNENKVSSILEVFFWEFSGCLNDIVGNQTPNLITNGYLVLIPFHFVIKVHIIAEGCVI